MYDGSHGVKQESRGKAAGRIRFIPDGMRITEAVPTGKSAKTTKHSSYDTLRECEKVVSRPMQALAPKEYGGCQLKTLW